MLPLVIVGFEAKLRPGSPRFQKAKQALLELSVVRDVNYLSDLEAVLEEAATDIVLADELLRCQHLLQLCVYLGAYRGQLAGLVAVIDVEVLFSEGRKRLDGLGDDLALFVIEQFDQLWVQVFE